jgi:hypothetical protein
MNAAGDAHPEVLDAAIESLGRSGLTGVVPVTGVSMRPTLREGDRVLGDFRPRVPRRGDVLLFRQDGLLIVHRMIGRGRAPDGTRTLIARGDGRLMPDPPVRPEHVLGVVVAAERRGEWRGLRGRRARLYGWLLALHARCWSAIGGLAGRLQDRATRGGRRWPLRSLVWRVDQRLLRIADAIWFGALHPRSEDPAGSQRRDG